MKITEVRNRGAEISDSDGEVDHKNRSATKCFESDLSV